MSKKQFKTESKRLLDLMINSVYTNKEIFLRELISNASDALDKLYFKTLTDNSDIKRGDLEIRIAADKTARTLTISDNGIGMTKEELESNLGTIAKSGTLAFKNDNELDKDDMDVIGQFGVGFYSAFMVSDKVSVVSKAYGSDEAYEWESTGADGYTIKEAEKADNGTEITPYHSSVDKDGDGTDDQTDILKNALVYVKKRPVYKSRYYQTGYPDDRYGVCTDVVGYALKKSGYDLRELVDEDIRKNSKDYDIDEPDKNIDFRRVKNLKIYFEHTATSLTTDVNDIEQWQGGDIVVFKNHIGVISDRRNVEGVPYVIHHNDPYQKNYEEDILQERTDIVGHFRIS